MALRNLHQSPPDRAIAAREGAHGDGVVVIIDRRGIVEELHAGAGEPIAELDVLRAEERVVVQSARGQERPLGGGVATVEVAPRGALAVDKNAVAELPGGR